MRDLMLSFADEAEWLAQGVARDPGELELDIVGALPGLSGLFVNVRCTDERNLSDLATFEVHPANPSRVWLGA